jgi:hypothetical protein
MTKFEERLRNGAFFCLKSKVSIPTKAGEFCICKDNLPYSIIILPFSGCLNFVCIYIFTKNYPSMKIKLIIITLLLCSCTQNKFSGYVYDFDNGRPIKNVVVKSDKSTTISDSTGYFVLNVNSNSNAVLNLKREGYANKKVVRKPDKSKKTNEEKVKENTIYMFKSESDFANK